MLNWSSTRKSNYIDLSNSNSYATVRKNSRNKWNCCLSDQLFSAGQYDINFTILQDPPCVNTWRIVVGIVPTTFSHAAATQWVGSQKSLGYIGGLGGLVYNNSKVTTAEYGTKFGVGDVVTVHLDYDKGTVGFSVNNAYQGVAWTHLHHPCYAAFSAIAEYSCVGISHWVAPSVSPPRPMTPLKWLRHSSGLTIVDNKVTKSRATDQWEIAIGEKLLYCDVCYFEIVVESANPTTNTWMLGVGVCPAVYDVTSTKRWLGSQDSYGYIGGTGGIIHGPVSSHKPYGAKFGKTGDVIGVIADFPNGTIEFVRNGVRQGIAFNLGPGKLEPCSPCVSFTSYGSTMRLQTGAPPSIEPVLAPTLCETSSGETLTPCQRAMQLSELSITSPTQQSCIAYLFSDHSSKIVTSHNVAENIGSGDRWQMAIGNTGFDSGRHSIEFHIEASLRTTNTWRFVVGVCPSTTKCNHKHKWVGSQGSFGFVGGTGHCVKDHLKTTPFDKPLSQGDILVCLLDFGDGTISFHKRGSQPKVAFSHALRPNLMMYPCVSMTGTGTRISIHEPPTAISSAMPPSVPYSMPQVPEIIRAPSLETRKSVEKGLKRIGDLEKQYEGMLKLSIKSAKNVPVELKNEIFANLAQWRDENNFSEQQHNTILEQLGVTPAQFTEFKQQEQESDPGDDKLCIVCMVGQRNACFVACGHIHCCIDCAESLTECPVCRRPSKGVIKVFF